MKMKCKMQQKLKPFISILLAVLLVFGLAPASFFPASEVLAKDLELSGVLSGTEGNITWQLTPLEPSDWDLKIGTPYKLTLSGTGDMKSYVQSGNSFQYPDKKGTYKTCYYSTAPWKTYAPYICSLEIGNGITSVGSYSFFSCVSLKEVSIPASITKIGGDAFSNCYLLESVTGCEGLTEIQSYAFSNTSELRSVQLEGSRVHTIGESAFCEAFNSSTKYSNQITLPPTLKKIDSKAFKSSNLAGISLPASVEEIGSEAFMSSRIESITMPSNMPLAGIGEKVFAKSHLRNIILPNNITEIGKNAFSSCPNLKEIILNNGLLKIGENAFAPIEPENHFDIIETISIPDTVTEIGEKAFEKCAVTEVHFGADLQTIGNSAFIGCNNLSKVSFSGNQLTSIGNSAFSVCSNLGEISLPGSVSKIGNEAFSKSGLSAFTVPQSTSDIGYGILYNCTNLDRIAVADGNPNFTILGDALYEIKNAVPYRAIAYPIKKAADSYTVADGAEVIDEYAFAKSKFKELILSDSVKNLNSNAFADCAGLVSVYIGKSVSTIATGGSGAFYNCKKLSTITTSSEDSNLVAKENVLYNKDFTELYLYAFAKTDLEYHVLDTVTTIKDYAIYVVPELKELYLPETLKSLSAGAVNTCEKLKSIYFAGGEPSKVTNSISSNAKDLLLFRLKDVQWNDSAWTSYEFAEWDPNEDFVDGGEIAPSEGFEGFSWEYERFNGRLTLNGAEFIPDYNADSDLPPWNDYIGEIQTIEANVEKVGDYAFYQADRLRRLSKEQKPTAIGAHAFENCKKLVYITLSDEVSIGEYAFAGNISLNKSLSLNHAAAVGAHAFENCSSLKSISLAFSSAESIGESAFAGCTALSKVTLPFSPEYSERLSIGDNVFKDCIALESIMLPAKLDSIGAGAFNGCVKLSEIDIPSKVSAIKDDTFAGCTALKKVIFYTDSVSAGLTSIGKGAFDGCSSLRTISVPESTSSIGANAFSGNTSLENVYFKGAYPKENIADDCFLGCNNNLTLYYTLEKDEGERWASYDGVWNGLPLKVYGHFYTEGRDHYNFSNSALSFGYSDGYRIPRQRYVDALDSIIIGTYYYAINKYWNGSCYGMASTSLEFYENINERDLFHVQSYHPSRKYLHELDQPNNPDNALTQLIETYQVSQYQPQISSCAGEIIQNMNQYYKLKERIIDFEESGGLETDDASAPIVITVYSVFGGHALVPVSWNQMEDGNYEVKVYDCNYPESFQSLIIHQDMKSFSYGFYNQAISFVDYKTIASGMAEIQPLESAAADTLYLSVNKETKDVTDALGNGIDKIEGGYEQKPFMGSEEDVFSGIKSYVLPKGNYTIDSDSSEETKDSESEENQNEEKLDTPVKDTDSLEDVTFYMAANDLFAEVTASDEDAALSVDTSDTVEDKVEMTLTSGESSAEDGYTSITLMNDSGLERVIEVSGYDGDIKVGVSEEEVISITASQTSSVTIDGQKANSENGQVLASFTSTADENPFKVSGLSVTAHCDEKNKLSADISAHVLNRSESVQPVELTAEFYDKNDNRVAAYHGGAQELNQGLEFVSLNTGLLNANFKQDEGEAVLYCKLMVKTSDFSVFEVSDGVTVVLTKQPDVENPGDGNENDPGNNPGNNEPDDGKEPGGDNNEPDDGKEPGGDNNEPDDGKEPGGDNNEPDDGKEPDGDNNPDDGKEPDGDNNPDDSKEPGDSNNSGDTNQPNDGSVSGDGTNTTGPADTNINPLVKEVESVSASINKIKIGVGESYRLETSVTPADAVNQTLIFTSSNKNVTVNKDGIIKGKKAGTSWIMVSSENGKTARVKVDVKKAPKRVWLNETVKRLKKGRTFQIKVKLPKKTASHKITFTSNKKSVAAVSATGKVKALKKGSAVITVKTFNGKKAKLKVRVK